MREVRDVIHGLIKIWPDEQRVIDSLPFQRLRQIRQLALAHYVYPGAHHSRFEHGIGTMHLAAQIGRKLELSDDDISLLRLAALLHDVGHGPFSHVSEPLLKANAVKGAIVGSNTEEIHENITVDIVTADTEVAKQLSDHQREAIAKIISGTYKPRYMKEIISGPLDADKLDYLLRDCHYTGVSYGLFDLPKIIDSYTVWKDPKEEYLCIDEEGLHAIEQFVLAKFYMTRQVYHHRVRAITDAMIVRGLTLAIENEASEFVGLYSYDKNEDFLNRYLDMTDDLLLWKGAECGVADAQNIFRRLLDRRLFKKVCEITISQYQPNKYTPTFRDRAQYLGSNSELKREIEERVAGAAGISSGLVITDFKSLSNPTVRSPGVHLDEKTILISRKDGSPISLEDIEDTILKRLGEKDVLKILIYLPVEESPTWAEERYSGQKEEKDALARECEDIVIAVLEGG